MELEGGQGGSYIKYQSVNNKTFFLLFWNSTSVKWDSWDFKIWSLTPLAYNPVKLLEWITIGYK